MKGPLDRKAAAEQLLGHELMIEAREKMRESLTQAMWRRHAMSDSDKARLDGMAAHYETFWNWFERVLADGRVAEAEQSARERLAQAFKSFKERI
ncbi:MAG: hypothetical protein ACOYLL_14415 [Beijerinckiaceae bacterium]